jgi:uncharacterized protein YegP (UPF0339 family)
MKPEDIATRHAARRPREPAAEHFRKLGGTGWAFADRSVAQSFEPVRATRGTFEIYREDEVRTTSTRFCGGDWHWRLSGADGLVLLDTGGYPSERECRQAVAILKKTASLASVSWTS